MNYAQRENSNEREDEPLVSDRGIIAIDQDTNNLESIPMEMEANYLGTMQSNNMHKPFNRSSKPATLNADMNVVVNEQPIAIHPLHQKRLSKQQKHQASSQFQTPQMVPINLTDHNSTL